ncbi:MAG: hypothetical protein CL868_11095 [Cytophagaceae bacterium]|nr:hypothetical protein [Cytophagaceae bacterium]|tara:strand:+ start:2370 stop:3260 length:891 start_codon:yes stop_codon:yes gene_type:complete
MKKIALILLILVVAGLSWYLFIKPYDYSVSFRTKYGPSAVYYDFLDARDINTDSLLSTKKYSEIQQVKTLGDTIFNLRWHFAKASDSTTKVTVDVRDETHTVAARVNVLNPFNSRYTDQLKSYFNEYNWLMDEKQREYTIGQTIKDTVFAARECICTSSSSKIRLKAHHMVEQLADLDDFFFENQVKPTGDPLLLLEKWNEPNDYITFDFCFPILKNDSLRLTPKTHFISLPSLPSYSAAYKGNYKYSHRQWAEMGSKLAEEGAAHQDTIIEVYHNSPLVDTNPKSWKATIYIPKK